MFFDDSDQTHYDLLSMLLRSAHQRDDVVIATCMAQQISDFNTDSSSMLISGVVLSATGQIEPVERQLIEQLRRRLR